MNQPAATADSPTPQRGRPSPPAVDALATGVAFALSLTVVQRLTGFLRSVLFCRLLDADQLGLWSLGFSFLVLAAPLAVLGLPGSFGRYVEHYRQRGQLRPFLRRTTAASGLLACAMVAAVCLGRQWCAKIIFNDVSQAPLVLVLGAALLVVISFNFLVELLTALRQVRIVSLMQFSSSLVFAGAGVSLICSTRLGASGVVLAYAGGCLVACVPAVVMLRRFWRSCEPSGQELAQRDLWSKLLPFAGWVWMINLLATLFDVADRYMIVHFAPLDVHQAQAVVGQYHSSRVVPVLMMAVAEMLSAIILPYLTADWEGGRKRAVSRRLNLALKLVGLSFTGGAVLMLLGSPLLFGWAFGGKYDAGLAVLPWTLTYSIWFSLGLVAQNYLWCAEKARLVSGALFIGLVANLGLNLLLLPLWGLHGAVLATSAGNALALAFIFLLGWREGLQIDRGTILISALPLVLALGAWPAAAVLISVVWLVGRVDWLLERGEKEQLIELAGRWRGTLRSLAAGWKAASP